MMGWSTKKRGWALFGCAGAIVLAGCSSSGGGGNCGKVAACGGDVVGTWTVSDSCASTGASSNFLGSQCPSATAQVGTFSVTGRMTFQPDMTYSIQGALTETVIVTIPTSCLGNTTCDQLAQAFQTNVMASGLTAQCTGTGSACSCTLSMGTQSVSTSGTYSTSGTTITTTPTGGTASTSDYCVQGTTLHDLSPQSSMTMAGMGQITITGDIVAQKQ